MQRTRRDPGHRVATAVMVFVLGAMLLGGLPGAATAKRGETFSFDLVVSAGASGCLPDARGHVTLEGVGPNQRMEVSVEGLAPDAEYTLFVLQLPTSPFGIAWYQGDIETNGRGRGSGSFKGIFSDELFVFAPGTGAAPQPHPGVDAATNPPFGPIHTFHLGLWFADPADAVSAGCPGTVTGFDGDHEAGIQVLNSSNFPDTAGPLGEFAP